MKIEGYSVGPVASSSWRGDSLATAGKLSERQELGFQIGHLSTVLSLLDCELPEGKGGVYGSMS